MRARSKTEIEGIRRSVTEWRRLSDRLFSVGPFGVGLDGLLTWVPGVGGVYGLGVGGFLMLQAHRARASKGTIAKMGMLIGLDALVGEVPLVGDAFDFFFRAHARSANMLLKHIDATHYVDDSEAAAGTSGRDALHKADIRADGGKRRLAYLRD
jgi:hypothetical protein